MASELGVVSSGRLKLLGKGRQIEKRSAGPCSVKAMLNDISWLAPRQPRMAGFSPNREFCRAKFLGAPWLPPSYFGCRTSAA